MSKHLAKAIGQLHEKLVQEEISLSPVVVLGMHRSGTTMLARVLQSAGIFMGTRLSGNHEPRVFQDTNRQIFDYFNVGWLDIDQLPTPYALYTGFTGLAIEIANRLSDDILPCFFASEGRLAEYWGFKDPRSSVTAGLLLRLFPEARALFIHRNALDVAASVLHREQKKRGKYPESFAVPLNSVESSELLMRSVKAWEVYNARILEILPKFKLSAVLKYEAVVEMPETMLEPAFQGIGLEVDMGTVSHVGITSQRVGSGREMDLDITKVQEYLELSPVARSLNL